MGRDGCCMKNGAGPAREKAAFLDTGPVPPGIHQVWFLRNQEPLAGTPPLGPWSPTNVPGGLWNVQLTLRNHTVTSARPQNTS